MSKWISERTQNHLPNRSFLLGMSSLVAAPAFAHHGWRFTPNGEFELRGIIREIKEKAATTVLTVDADGEIWRVDVGPLQRRENELSAEHPCQCGADITVVGQRAAGAAVKSMSAACITIDKKNYAVCTDEA